MIFAESAKLRTFKTLLSGFDFSDEIPSFRKQHPGSALIITFIFLIMLSLQVAMISLIAVRGFSEEGVLLTQNISARRSAETALNRLETKLHNFLLTGTTATAESSFAQGQANAITATTLSTDNPDGGTDTMPVTISAWVQERRGDMYHMVGRATSGGVDILMHRWVRVKVCPSGGALTTIASGIDWPGDASTVASPVDGRVFFGQMKNPGNFWTWDPATGLSVIISGIAAPGFYATSAVSPIDGRVFFG